MSIILPVTLSSAAAAAILAIWLMIRVGQVRVAEKVSVGDGGNEKVIRRMRAHANFVESAPFVVLLIGAIELAGKGGMWLPYVAGIYFIGRILHGFGMEGGSLGWGRTVGVFVTLLTLLGLGIYAALVGGGWV
ncbi:MAPEG family protein [Altererythrobacter sp.]|uniref:MAPEG family protein n=1 Tax=Altererythrobacter sp. TaxID=1872480 RepID=UPI003D01ACE3